MKHYNSVIKIFLFFLFLHCFNAVYSQNALLKISYNFKHLQDTTDRNKIYEEKMVLYVSKDASCYDSYDRFLKDSINKSLVYQKTSENGTIVVGYNGQPDRRTASISTVYQFVKLNELNIVQHFFGNEYLIKSEIPKINWQISAAEKEIEGIKCQKATCSFKGRTYEAWFAADFPFPFGPWKLNGLPGLILEATDSKNEVSFICSGVEQLKTPYQISLPEKTISTTKKDFDAMVSAAQSDPIGFINAQTGINLKPANGNNLPAPKKTVKKTMNNPIELTDN